MMFYFDILRPQKANKENDTTKRLPRKANKRRKKENINKQNPT